MIAILTLLRSPSAWLDRRIDARVAQRENAAIDKLLATSDRLIETTRAVLHREAQREIAARSSGSSTAPQAELRSMCRAIELCSAQVIAKLSSARAGAYQQ